VIELPALAGTERELWRALLDLAERQPDGWTLVGGQMVLPRALEQGRVPPRVTRDLDVLADIRARPAVLPRIVTTLSELGFEVELAAPDESGHRFKRGNVTIDLLAADNLGARAILYTVGSLTTVAIAGGPAQNATSATWLCSSRLWPTPSACETSSARATHAASPLCEPSTMTSTKRGSSCHNRSASKASPRAPS
jgi:hypothetical protein